MIEITCKVPVFEVDGGSPDGAKPLLVQSYAAKGCAQGQYVTLVWRGHSITIRADDIRVAAENAARTVGDLETTF